MGPKSAKLTAALFWVPIFGASIIAVILPRFIRPASSKHIAPQTQTSNFCKEHFGPDAEFSWSNKTLYVTDSMFGSSMNESANGYATFQCRVLKNGRCPPDMLFAKQEDPNFCFSATHSTGELCPAEIKNYEDSKGMYQHFCERKKKW